MNPLCRGCDGKFRVSLGGITDARGVPREGVCAQMSAHAVTTESAELPSTRQVARKLGVVAAVVAIGAVLATQLSGLQEIGHQLAGADGGWIAAALILELASTACFAIAFHGVYDRRPSRRASASMSMAVQGMNIVLPSGGAGGLAVGAVLLDRAGVPRSFAASRTVALFLITSLVSFVAVVIAGFGVAAGVLSGEATLAVTLVPGIAALLLIVAVFALPRSQGAVKRASAGRLSTALANAREYLRDGVGASAELLRSGDRLVIAGAIGYFAFDVAALAAAFHAVGPAGLPIGLLVLAYTLGHGGAIIPIPGSAEGGLIGMFVLYGMPVSTATAAVLAYRALHAGVPMLLGAIGLADVRRLLRDPAQAVAPKSHVKVRHQPAPAAPLVQGAAITA
jgi:putative heme transporter